MMDNVNKVKAASDEGQLYFGTIDAWLIWYGSTLCIEIDSQLIKMN